MIHIFEHKGVMLEVDYTPPPTADAPTTLHSVRVMDASYRATGPNLFPLLHDTLLITGTHGPFTDAQTFISAICEEISDGC